MTPPIYILVTVSFPDVKSRARYFGIISGAAGLGAAAGPLIGGVITSTISWRASFGLQVLIVAWIIFQARGIKDPGRPGVRPRFDLGGAVLSAAGLFFIVLGFLQSRTYGFFVSRTAFTVGTTVVIPKGGVSPLWLYVAVGALFLLWFFLHVLGREKKGKDVLLASRLFRNRASNLGLGTQFFQWLTLQGTFFVLSVFLQEVWHYSAIKTGLLLTPATIAMLVASAAAQRLARRYQQRTLTIAGFLLSTVGMLLLLALIRPHSSIASWIPGELILGVGTAIMLTSSVNIVQSSFPDADQGDISGLSRSVSNLGSSFGTALVGSVLVAYTYPAEHPFAIALIVLTVITLLGLVTAVLVPRHPARSVAPPAPRAPDSGLDGSAPSREEPSAAAPDDYARRLTAGDHHQRHP
jgi:MFS family permease